MAVVAPAHLLGLWSPSARRWVIVRVAERRVALAVDEVVGVCSLPAADRTALPPLLRDAEADLVSAVAALDRELLMLLEGARLLPDLSFEIDPEGADPATEEVSP